MYRNINFFVEKHSEFYKKISRKRTYIVQIYVEKPT